MINLPQDMLDACKKNPPNEEWIIACLKMQSGDIWLSDRPISSALFAIIGIYPEVVVEDWGVLDDGLSIEKIMSMGSEGYLCCPGTKITLIRADDTKTLIDSIINEGIHNKRIELYRWFSGMTSSPVLIEILFCQDPIEIEESSMLFSFDAVGAFASEDKYIVEKAENNKIWPYVVGKAESVKLELLEELSSKYTVLIGNVDGEEVDEEYTGLIRVEDATKLESGIHIINGEQVYITNVSAGYKKITLRGQNGTEQQNHENGSIIYPVGAKFKYAACSGPVGSFEKLRTSDAIDIYDEDGDLDTEEYRDLYSGGNEEYHPELNPAQIFFNGIPFLKKDQDYSIDDKSFYGNYYELSSLADVKNPSDINKKSGQTGLYVSFRRFSEYTGDPNDYWFVGTTIPVPSLPGDGGDVSTYEASENINDGSGFFEVNQSFGNYLSGNGLISTAYREFRANGNCPPGESGWTSAAPVLPDLNGFVFTDDGHRWGMVVQRMTTSFMSVKLDIIETHETPTGTADFTVWSQTFQGGSQAEHNWLVDFGVNQFFLTSSKFSDFLKNRRRMKMRFTVLQNNGTPSTAYAYIRVGSSIASGDGKFHYGLGALWNYLDAAPSSYIISKFGRNLSSKGNFVSAKVRIRGVLRNSENKASGEIKIYDNLVLKNTTNISDGQNFDVTIDLDATTWTQLQSAEIKIEILLDYALDYNYTEGTVTPIRRTDGYAGIELSNGIEYLISYISNSLDNVQVKKAENLIVDVVSLEGQDWTPSNAIKYLCQGYTSWHSDMLDLQSINDRNIEYDANEHYLNGTINYSKFSDIIKEIARQGFMILSQKYGAIKIHSYLSEPVVPIASYDIDSVYFGSRKFSSVNTSSIVQKLIINYDKKQSNNIYEKKYTIDNGEYVQNSNTINLDLVKSDNAVQQAADWIFSMISTQLQHFAFDCNFMLIDIEGWDKITMDNFIKNETPENVFVISSLHQFAQPKNSKPPIFTIKTIRRQ